MTPLLDQLMLPQRLAAAVVADLRRIADATLAVGGLARDLRRQLDPVGEWMNGTVAALESLRDEASGIRAAADPIAGYMDTLSSEFGRADDEIARLREALIPELAGFRASADRLHEEMRQVRELLDVLDADVKDMGQRVTAEMRALRDTVRALVRDADDISEVVEPLQSATERVGRVADRLPGGQRKR
jgi:methyl-accepting chemotaxis protein